MDPLSDVLSLLKPRSTIVGGFDAGAPWSIRFSQRVGIKCYAVAAGACWLSLDGVPDPVRLRTGDCFLLPRGWPFQLASDLALPPVDAATVFPVRSNGGIAVFNDGSAFSTVGGHFALDGDHAGLLLGMLPPVVHIRSEADRAAMRWLLERMRQEVRDPQPGSVLVAQQLAIMMLVQALRLHLADGQGEVGWLFALADKRMRAVLAAIHDDPSRSWTLRDLAARAGMSRSSFALRFRQMVGTSPMDYLTRWRMRLAGYRLVNSDDPLSAIALSLGYESDSAFSTTFKRVMHRPPRQWRRGRADREAAAE